MQKTEKDSEISVLKSLKWVGQWCVKWTVAIMRMLHEDLIAAFPFVNGDDIPFSVSVQCPMPNAQFGD